MLSTVSPAAYWTTVTLCIGSGVILAVVARRHPGRWREIAARVIGTILAAVAVSYVLERATSGSWSAKTDLPIALCDAAVFVAAAACWWHVPLLVELTWFWGLAGTLQGLLTPDLNVGFPHLEFWQYVLGHAGIICAALLLVVGMRITPRPGAVLRVFTVTLAYTAFVGIVDAATGSDYMFLREPPSEWTLLRVLGPWPWYIASAAAVALVLLVALDAPFWRGRRLQRSTARLTSDVP
ncbi:MAG TPA: TIGR02206 family membrane protein [Acidimicrobiales bacterium]|nr:TIGR02206 family membrane protein [Acidimicrobiales bacterium]